MAFPTFPLPPLPQMPVPFVPNMPGPDLTKMPLPQMGNMLASVDQGPLPLGKPAEQDLFAFDPATLMNNLPQQLPQETGGGTPATMSPWQQFASRLQNDQALQLGLLTMGLNMLQPIQPNQTSLGHLASSIGQGVNTFGAQRENIRRQEVQKQEMDLKKRQVDQGDQRLALGQKELDLAGRRQDEVERTGQVQREGMGLSNEQKRQTIEQNAQQFPKLLAKIDAEIAKMVTDGKLDDARAELLREQAKLFPQQVNADLIRARASETSANASLESARKQPAQVQMFESTAQAMVNSGQAKTLDEAKALLGVNFFNNRGGSTAAAVQETNQLEQLIKQANPKQDGESDAAYQQRISKELLKFKSTSKTPDYAVGLQKFLSDNMVDPNDEESVQKYTALYNQTLQAAGRQVPGAAAPAGGAQPQGAGAQPAAAQGGKADFSSTDKVDPSKLEKGRRYKLKLPDGQVVSATWNGKNFVRN